MEENKAISGKINLSECETWILSILLESNEPLTLPQIRRQAIKRFGKIWKSQTVCTFLKRMNQKGYISIYKEGSFYQYTADIKLSNFREKKLNEIKELLLFDSMAEMTVFMRTMYSQKENEMDNMEVH